MRMRSKNKTKRMRSKSMRSKSKSMRSKSKSMRSKSKRMLSKSKRMRKTMRRTRRNMRGGFEPAPGGPYFAGSSAPFPSGTYLPVSKLGVPAGSFDPAVPEGPYPVQGQAGGKHHLGKRSGHMKRMQRRHMHGGGLSSFISSILPDEIVNIGRSVPSSLGHLADKFNGSISSPSSLVYPTQQPHVYHGSSGATAPQMAPIDVQDAFNRANASVGSI